jgi:prephenate dehydrogenase
MGPQEAFKAFLAVITVIGGFALLLPMARAVAERIRARGQPQSPELSADILAELSDLRHEVGELAERMDFAERLLAQHKEKELERLGPGRS